MILIVLGALSHILTFLRHDPIEVYRSMNYPERKIEQMEKLDFLGGGFMAWSALLWAVPSLGYLIFVRRFFKSPELMREIS